jgi:prophage regulatory protein
MEKHYRLAEVRALTGLGRSTIYDQMNRGKFPHPVKLTGKIVGWPESSLSAWIASRQGSPGAEQADALSHNLHPSQV